mmetsp:Transcript_1578/g.3463  ORF Transcript_1578/g.3463 Transcript_1578/m.3463 type:complete len:125 (+) Transcript_1578:2-376(+)
MVSILDSVKDAVYFTRIWVVYEVFVALVQCEIPVCIAVPPHVRQQLETMNISELRSCINVDVMLATATQASDEEAIKKQVKLFGIGTVNTEVKKLFVALITDVLLDSPPSVRSRGVVASWCSIC